MSLTAVIVTSVVTAVALAVLITTYVASCKESPCSEGSPHDRSSIPMYTPPSDPQRSSNARRRRRRTRRNDENQHDIRSISQSENRPGLSGPNALERYKMTHPILGQCLIFNMEKFENDRIKKREGTRWDCINLHQCFTNLGFSVQIQNSETSDNVLQILQMQASSDHRAEGCFVCIFLSHGCKDDIECYDKAIPQLSLSKPFETCRSLAGKPKLFFIQACRGGEEDFGLSDEEVDATPCPGRDGKKRIPRSQDFLLAYATGDGYVAYRNATNGSRYIQMLVSCLNRYGKEWDIQEILKDVERKVACMDATHFQQPWHRSTLTKKLFFY